jgi:acyl-CoA synthetase (AMP-forming)/AMP-acid ligase II/acyl carrier protein
MVFDNKKNSTTHPFGKDYQIFLKTLEAQSIFFPYKTRFNYVCNAPGIHNHLIKSDQTLIDTLSKHAQRTPFKTAFIFLNEETNVQSEITFFELHQKAKMIASYLQKNNLTSKPILLLHPPGIEFIIDFFGCIYAGAIAVPLYPPKRNAKQSRFQSIIDDTNATLAFTTTKIIDQSETSSSTMQALQGIQLLAHNILSPKLESEWVKPSIHCDDIAFIQYTSGSTSNPKGVINTHKNIFTNEEMIRKAANTSSKTRVCGWAPHYHDMGIIANILHPIHIGALSVLMSPTTFIQKPLRWLETISKYAITYSGGPNFSYELCVDKITEEELASLNLSSWEVAFNGAEPIKAETLVKFENKFKACNFSNKAFFPLFGLAETTVFCTGSHASEKTKYLDVDKHALAKNKIIKPTCQDNLITLVSCGKTWGDQIVKIVDPVTLTENKNNIVGEIWVKGSNVSKGYWNNKNLTDKTFHAQLKNTDKDFYLRTGDLGFFDSNNDLFVTGRIKDMMIIRGKNIYPHDIENVIESIDDSIKNGGCAVFEYESESTQKITAVAEIERTSLKSINPLQLKDKISQKIAQECDLYLDDVVFINPMSLPKTSSGKKQRQLCKKNYLDKKLSFIKNYTQKKSIPKKYIQKPRTHTEIILTDLIKKILDISEICLESSLNHLGGNSLVCIQLIMEIKEHFGIEISPCELSNNTLTLKYLSKLIDDKQNELIMQLNDLQLNTKSTTSSEKVLI